MLGMPLKAVVMWSAGACWWVAAAEGYQPLAGHLEYVGGDYRVTFTPRAAALYVRQVAV